MKRACLWTVAAGLTALLPAASPQRDSAVDLLAKASAAFEQNRLQEVNWNWVSHERRMVTDNAGHVVQRLPEVTIESVIRSNGTRCSAVSAWGDGKEAYLAKADPDARCQAVDQESNVKISALLKSRSVKILSESPAGMVLAIAPDRADLRSGSFETRCAASIRATVVLDPATLFPRQVEGTVVDNGCDQLRTANTYYDNPGPRPVRASIHKGTSFQADYELQKDKFGFPERSFWIEVRWHANILRWIQGGGFVSWGRPFEITPRGAPQHIVEDIDRMAQEFGAQSFLR